MNPGIVAAKQSLAPLLSFLSMDFPFVATLAICVDELSPLHLKDGRSSDSGKESKGAAPPDTK